MSISNEDLETIQQKYAYLILAQSTQTIDNIKLQASELIIPRIFDSMLEQLIDPNYYQRKILIIVDQQQEQEIAQNPIFQRIQYELFSPNQFYTYIQQCQNRQKTTLQKFFEDSLKCKLASAKLVACQQIILLYKQFLTLNLHQDQEQYYKAQILKYEKTVQQCMKQQSPQQSEYSIMYQPKNHQFNRKSSDSCSAKNSTGLTAMTPIYKETHSYMIGCVSPLPCQNPNLARFYVNEQLPNIKGKYQSNNYPTLIINGNIDGCCMQQSESGNKVQDLSNNYKRYEQNMKKVILLLNKLYYQRIQECKYVEQQIYQFIQDINEGKRVFKIISENQEQNKQSNRRKSNGFSHNSSPINEIKTQWFTNSQQNNYNMTCCKTYDIDYLESQELQYNQQLLFQPIENIIRPYYCYNSDVIQINNFYIYNISKKYTVYEIVTLLTKCLMYSDQQIIKQKEQQNKFTAVCINRSGYYHLFEKNNQKQRKMIETTIREDTAADECNICGCRYACYRDHINTKNHIQEFRNALHNSNIKEESFNQLMKITSQENIVNQQLTDILMTSSLMTGRSWNQTQQKLNNILRKYKIQRTPQFLDQTMNPMNYTPEFFKWSQDISQQRANLTEQICQKLNEGNVNTKYLLLMNKIINNAIVEDLLLQNDYHIPLDALKQNTQKEIRKEQEKKYDKLTQDQIYVRKMLNAQYPEIQQPIFEDKPQQQIVQQQIVVEKQQDNKFIDKKINNYIEILQQFPQTIHKLMTYKIQETKIIEGSEEDDQQLSQLTTTTAMLQHHSTYNIDVISDQSVAIIKQQTTEDLNDIQINQQFVRVSRSQPFISKSQLQKFNSQQNKCKNCILRRSKSQSNYSKHKKINVNNLCPTCLQYKSLSHFLGENQLITCKHDQSLSFVRQLENPQSKLSRQYEICQQISTENKKKQIFTQNELLKNFEGKHYQLSPIISQNCQITQDPQINIKLQKSIIFGFYGIFTLLYGTPKIQRMLNQREYNIVDSLIGYSNAVNFNKGLSNCKIEATSLLFEQIEFIGTLLQSDGIL